MSVKMISWAWGVKVDNPTRKLVLVALADHANADGICWPSMEHISELAECSTRSVSRHIEALEAMGLVRRNRRAGKRGKFAGYEYTLAGPSRIDEPTGQDDQPSESPPDRLSAGEPDGTATPPQDSVTDGQSDRRSQSRTPPDRESAGPPDTESGGLKKEEPSVVEPSGNRHSGGAAAPRSNGRSKSRPRDELFEAIVEVCDGLTLDGLTKTERGRVNAACKELREIDATPLQVRRKAALYRTKFSGEVALTPQALTGNWSAVEPAATSSTFRGGVRMEE